LTLKIEENECLYQSKCCSICPELHLLQMIDAYVLCINCFDFDSKYLLSIVWFITVSEVLFHKGNIWNKYGIQKEKWRLFEFKYHLSCRWQLNDKTKCHINQTSKWCILVNFLNTCFNHTLKNTLCMRMTSDKDVRI
jgi:hypothetical protein